MSVHICLFVSREEGTIPYVPEIPINMEAIVNYNKSVYGINGIHTGSAGLESTSLILAYGLGKKEIDFWNLIVLELFWPFWENIMKNSWFVVCSLEHIFVVVTTMLYFVLFKCQMHLEKRMFPFLQKVRANILTISFACSQKCVSDGLWTIARVLFKEKFILLSLSLRWHRHHLNKR